MILFKYINIDLFLIESGGGTGPMKPGNLHASLACEVPIPAGEILKDEEWMNFFLRLNHFLNGSGFFNLQKERKM